MRPPAHCAPRLTCLGAHTASRVVETCRGVTVPSQICAKMATSPTQSLGQKWTGHFDGWDFYHYLDSPEQALLVVPLFSDIMPHSGGTLIATDSIGVVAKFLAAHPEGVHPDGTQGGGYLIPSLIEQCTQFVEITGNAGDLALLHPYMLHRAAANPSGVARFIQNGRLSLAEPLNFSRSNPADYSLVELAVLRALGTDRLRDWKPSGPRENNDMCTDWGRVPPRPFRSDAEREEQAAVIAMEHDVVPSFVTSVVFAGTLLSLVSLTVVMSLV